MAQSKTVRVATEAYADAAATAAAGSGVPDATTTSKGVVQLAGDLGGTSAAPTVPGLAGKAPTSRTVTAGTGLTGGGDLSADRTLAVAYGTTAGTAAQGNDSRITGAAQKSANLSDLTDASAARTSLGLAAVASSGSASNLTSGSVPAARFGDATIPIAAVNATGTASASTFLRGDGAWAASVVAPAYPALASGNYYFTASPTNTGTSTLGGGGGLRLVPWLLTTTTSLTRLGTEVTAAGDASSVVRLGIYADDGTGMPGSLVLDAGTVSGAAVAVLEVTISLTLQPGLYWVGAVAQNVTSAPTLRTCTAPPISPNLVRLGTTAPAANVTFLAVQMLSVPGALPSTFTFGGGTTAAARTHVKVA